MLVWLHILKTLRGAKGHEGFTIITNCMSRGGRGWCCAQQHIWIRACVSRSWLACIRQVRVGGWVGGWLQPDSTLYWCINTKLVAGLILNARAEQTTSLCKFNGRKCIRIFKARLSFAGRDMEISCKQIEIS